jgi:dipeptidyl aminopeptidase/acylaminoacyl peptidase
MARVRTALRLLILSAAPAVAALLLFLPARASGGEIAYVANDYESIHLVQADGSADRQLLSGTAGNRLSGLTWSPDGNVLVYNTYSSASPAQTGRTFLYDMSSGHSTQLSARIRGPIAYFPDGKRLLEGGVDISDDAPCGSLVSIDIASGTATPLMPMMCTIDHIQVAPDGAAAIVSGGWYDVSVPPTGDKPGPPAFHVVNVSLDSGEITIVSDPTCPSLYDSQCGWQQSGAVSPDNQMLAYVAEEGQLFTTPWDVVVAARDGSNAHSVWTGPPAYAPSALSFSPDSSRVAFSLTKPGIQPPPPLSNNEIWVMGIDGSGLQRIAAGLAPFWRPE